MSSVTIPTLNAKLEKWNLKTNVRIRENTVIRLIIWTNNELG